MLGLAASAATLTGGFATLGLRGRLSLILGLSAGIVIGVAALELFPEALELSRSLHRRWLAWVAVVAGLCGYIALSRLLAALPRWGPRLRGHVAPAGLTLHSFVDGCGIGLAFQLSPEVGWGVAIAILSHDVADGVNIVGLSLASHDRIVARYWLLLNGLAPIAGVVAGQMFRIPPLLLAALLAALAGAFFAIGGLELLPRSFRSTSRILALSSALVGFALIFLITQRGGSTPSGWLTFFA